MWAKRRSNYSVPRESGRFSLQAMQFNDFRTQSLKCIIIHFICSSIANLRSESIISKIRQWRIELCHNKKI